MGGHEMKSKNLASAITVLAVLLAAMTTMAQEDETTILTITTLKSVGMLAEEILPNNDDIGTVLAIAIINEASETISQFSPGAGEVVYIDVSQTSSKETHLSGFFVILNKAEQVTVAITHNDLHPPLPPTADFETTKKVIQEENITFIPCLQGGISEAYKKSLAKWEKRGLLARPIVNTIMWTLGQSHLPVKETDEGRAKKEARGEPISVVLNTIGSQEPS